VYKIYANRYSEDYNIYCKNLKILSKKFYYLSELMNYSKNFENNYIITSFNSGNVSCFGDYDKLKYVIKTISENDDFETIKKTL